MRHFWQPHAEQAPPEVARGIAAEVEQMEPVEGLRCCCCNCGWLPFGLDIMWVRFSEWMDPFPVAAPLDRLPPPMEDLSEQVEADQEGDEPRSDSSDSSRARPNC